MTRILEDILRAFYQISGGDRSVPASSKDISWTIQISRMAVSTWLGEIERMGYMVRGERKAIYLTESGYKLAREYFHRHVIVQLLFDMVGCTHDNVSKEVCQVEHYISAHALERFEQYLQGLGVDIDRAEEGYLM